ncbi:hypothetical protein BA060_02245 [Brucella sp. B13-0095]|nr:hypothetical protein BA060_02245 [Brucella sp. B13-0095]
MPVGFATSCMIARYQENRISFFLAITLFSLYMAAFGMGMIVTCFVCRLLVRNFGWRKLKEIAKLTREWTNSLAERVGGLVLCGNAV